MNTVSRLQPILSPGRRTGFRRSWEAIRVVVDEKGGANLPRVTLSPGDRLVIENRTRHRLQVAPVDFFGTAFSRFSLAAGEKSRPMVVTGLWFQVELHVDGRRFFPLDVYIAPNGTD